MRTRMSTMALVVSLVFAAVATTLAQSGQIAGTVRDAQGGVLPGVRVDVTSPALIEKTRVTVTDNNGQYRIAGLPVGTYAVTFTLEGFSKQQRNNIAVTTGFTTPVNAVLTIGQLAETVIEVRR